MMNNEPIAAATCFKLLLTWVVEKLYYRHHNSRPYTVACHQPQPPQQPEFPTFIQAPATTTAAMVL
jgi:hypothetical protein